MFGLAEVISGFLRGVGLLLDGLEFSVLASSEAFGLATASSCEYFSKIASMSAEPNRTDRWPNSGGGSL